MTPDAPPRPAWMDVSWREHLRWVRVGGRAVNVVDVGEGPAVVLLHGLAGCWQNWLETIEHMRNERNRGVRARIENCAFFGTFWLASKSDRVVRSARLRRALLLLR